MEYLSLILICVLVSVVFLGVVLIGKIRNEGMSRKDKATALTALLFMLPVIIVLASVEFLQTVEPEQTYVAVKVEKK